MNKTIILLITFILLLVSSTFGAYDKIFFDDFNDASYTNQGWSIGVGGFTEAWTIIYSTTAADCLHQDPFTNISFYDDDWQIQIKSSSNFGHLSCCDGCS